MDYKWIIYDIWIINRLYNMDYKWIINGIYMIYGLYMDYING